MSTWFLFRGLCRELKRVGFSTAPEAPYTPCMVVVNFMNHGEVNVAQEELNSFLMVTEDLKVKGLNQNNQNCGSDNTVTRDIPKPKTDSTPRPL